LAVTDRVLFTDRIAARQLELAERAQSGVGQLALLARVVDLGLDRERGLPIAPLDRAALLAELEVAERRQRHGGLAGEHRQIAQRAEARDFFVVVFDDERDLAI